MSMNDDYLKNMDAGAAAVRASVRAEEQQCARYFDPRRVQVLGIFDKLDDAGKDEALAMMVELQKRRGA